MHKVMYTLYEQVKEISQGTTDYLEYIQRDITWVNKPEGYKVAVTQVEIDEYPSYTRAFFLMVPSGGKVHRHKDNPRKETSFHIPVLTNPECFNYMETEEGESCKYQLKVGWSYYVNRSLLHWSVNDGQTDRVHLIIEI